jgi:hypothetical protein
MRGARTHMHENNVAMPVGFGVRKLACALGRGSLLPRMSWIL